MSIPIKLLFLVLLIIFCGAGKAQTNSNDKILIDPADIYQAWLERSELDRVLRVEEVSNSAPDETYLKLGFVTKDYSRVMVEWEELKRAYAEQSPLPFEEKLFYRAVHLLGVEEEQLILIIQDIYDEWEEPCFIRTIKLAGGAINNEATNCLSKIRDIEVSSEELNKVERLSVTEISTEQSRRALYDHIISFAKKKYSSTDCDARNPEVKVTQNNHLLRFKVTDLCKEVLIHEENPTVCQVLKRFGYDCNWIKRELLSFTIIQQKTNTGYRLYCELEGKYGSGIYQEVKDAGYIDMEADFDSYLEDYADRFVVELKAHLLK